MESLIPNQGWAEQRHAGGGARILLVNKAPQDLCCYGMLLQKAGCQVRATSSFADGAQCLEREPYDLILLDQGSGGFEGRKVLAKAMEIDPELRVVVLARSYDHACYLDAMQSGALDYLEGPLGADQIAALLETFIPRGQSARINSRPQAERARPRKQDTSKAKSNHVQFETGGRYDESTKSLSSSLRARQSQGDSSDSRNVRG